MTLLALLACRTVLLDHLPSSTADGTTVAGDDDDDSAAPTTVDTEPTGDTAVESSGSETGTAGCWLAPTNDPDADDAGLAPGPIDRFTIKVYYLKRPPGDQIVDPYADGDVWLAAVDDVIVFDATQKNAANEVCVWDAEPVWNVHDRDCTFERLNTTNPFLMQVRALDLGHLDVTAEIDGVLSNALVLEVR